MADSTSLLMSSLPGVTYVNMLLRMTERTLQLESGILRSGPCHSQYLEMFK